MWRTAFIACSKTKRSVPCTAEQMYQGALFKKALLYCKQHFDCIYILSAKYGLLFLDQIIQPYEQTLNTATKQELQSWACKVDRQIREAGLINSAGYWFFTGERYHRYFKGNKPLIGLSLGRQLKWFNERLGKNNGGFSL